MLDFFCIDDADGFYEFDTDDIAVNIQTTKTRANARQEHKW